MAVLEASFTMAEVAAMLRLSGSRVRQICIELNIGKKVGQYRFLTAADVDVIRDHQKPVGRPQKISNASVDS